MLISTSYNLYIARKVHHIVQQGSMTTYIVKRKQYKYIHAMILGVYNEYAIINRGRLVALYDQENYSVKSNIAIDSYGILSYARIRLCLFRLHKIKQLGPTIYIGTIYANLCINAVKIPHVYLC